MVVSSVNLGSSREIKWKGKIVTTGIFKYPVNHPIFLNVEQVDKDTICDRKVHGGIDKAVYAYGLQHYNYWKELYPDLQWENGMFGENITIENLNESEIYVGDKFQIGEAVIEATKPRQPCMKLGVRFGNMKMVKQFWEADKSGVYFKILRTGFVKPGDIMKRLQHFPQNSSIRDVYAGKRMEKLKQ